jgi:type IV fimbrial biogenesis protein FimT
MLSKQPKRRSRWHGRQLGVTLIETMMALGISGVLMTMALPSLTGLRARAAVDSQVHGFISALRRARSEAMTRGELVTVCALDADSLGSEKPSCADSGKVWSGGWLMFIDQGERGDVDEGDQVLFVDATGDGVGSMVGTQRYVTYRWSGELLGIAGHFRFLPPGQPAVDLPVEGSALVCVNKPGKPRVAKEAQCS